IPVWLDGLWGSMFSFEGGRVLKRPTRFRHPIQVAFGAPLASSASAFELRQREYRTLPVEILRSARRNFRRPLWVDAAGWHLTYGAAVLAALELRDRLRAAGVQRGERLGLLVPDDV